MQNATYFSARHRLDQMAANRGWSLDKRTLIDPRGDEHRVSVYTCPRHAMEVVWTGCDHVSRATLTDATGLIDETPQEWVFLQNAAARWNKRFSWCAVRIFDLAPADVSIIPHAKARSEAS